MHLSRSPSACVTRPANRPQQSHQSSNKLLDLEVELARRHGSPLSIILIDVDRFKVINDSYGHVAGDYALKALSDAIVTCARDSDIVFRFGGEEFVIVLSNTDLDGATLLAERFREAVQDLSIDFNDTQLKITMSLGVAKFHDGENRVKLIERTVIRRLGGHLGRVAVTTPRRVRQAVRATRPRPILIRLGTALFRA